jgi:hypothetical protein
MFCGHPTSRMRLHWRLHLMKGGQPFFPVQTEVSGAIPLFTILGVGGRTKEAVLPLQTGVQVGNLGHVSIGDAQSRWSRTWVASHSCLCDIPHGNLHMQTYTV